MSTSCSFHVYAVNIVPARRKKSPERAAYHHGRLRAALVEAGLRHLESREHGELSLRELARQVGVAPNAVYRHFADKEALLAALAAEGFRQLRAAQIAAAASHRDPSDVLLAAGRGYLAFAAAHPALYRLMFGRFGAGEHGDELAASARASFDVLLSQVASARGLASDDAAVLPGAVFAWGLTHGLSQLLVDGQFDHLHRDPAKLADTALQLAGLPKRKSLPPA